MKSKVIKSISFIIILITILILLSLLFNPKNNSNEAGMHNRSANGILAEPDNTIDLMVIGNSEAYATIVPMELWNDYGYTSYICASPEQPLPLTIRLVVEALKHQKPKMIILEASSMHLTSDLSDASDQVLNHFLKVFQYHDRWKNLSKEDFTSKPEYTNINIMKGYEYSNEVVGLDVNTIEKTSESAAIPRVNQIYIRLINYICKKNDIKFTIVRAPSSLYWSEEVYQNIKTFCDNNGMDYVDLNVGENKVTIDWTKETRDAGVHLNHVGAVKATKQLGKYLHSTNLLENHKEDEKFKVWNEQYSEYKKIVNEKEK